MTPERDDTDVSPAGEGPDLTDVDDFERFCRAEYQSVVGLAFALTGSSTAAEDLAQDAFFDAFRRWERLRAFEKPSAWVRRAVVNRSVSRHRRLMSEARAVARLGRRPEPVIEIPERDAEVWAAVRHLPRRQAQVFALTYVDDLAIGRVAEVLGISEETAKTHLKRARRTLMSRFNESGERTKHADR
jgi:RNA polymerase sigma-70 factor, ECF subfamily